MKSSSINFLKMINRVVLILFFQLSFFGLAFTQEQEDITVSIELNDGSEIVGELISISDVEIVIRNEELGLLTFSRDRVKRIIYLNDKGWRSNPNPTRYFLGQSAFTLPKGEGYYQNIYGVVNIFSYGLTNRLSVMGGIEAISLFSGSPLLLTNVKYGGKVSEKIHLAGSFTYLVGFGDFASDLSLGTLNALFTYGTKEHNITAGTGFAFSSDQFGESGILTIGGITRLSKRFSFISENYILTSGDGTVISGGLRLINKRSSIDLLLTQQLIPLLDIVFKF